MHASSMENMRRCIDFYLSEHALKAVDLGAMNVNGSYRELLPPNVDYVGVDLEPGPGVDLVLEEVYRLPFDDGSVDLVMSGQMLEHCGQFWRVFNEVFRILKPEGLAFMIAPSSGPVHRYPVDCYRFYPDSYQALAEWCGLRLVHSWTDERGPWRDIIGVFQKGSTTQALSAPPQGRPVAANAQQERHPDEEVEARAGVRSYLEVLRDLHVELEPKLYLEIGVRLGTSLSLASGPAIAIDPDPHPDLQISNPAVSLHRCTSDDYFFFLPENSLPRPVDLAFIDGMHLAEYVYRDFMNVERLMHPDGVVVVDDVLPNHPIQASRQRQSKVWTGDVWRFAELLAKKRPDLRLTWMDTSPTGLLIISRLNPKSQALWGDYNKAMRLLGQESGKATPEHIIRRRNAVAPTTENVRVAVGRG
jgi:SAM-dependent methyltransferase